MSIFTDSIRLLGRGVRANAPVLLTGVAVGGVFVTAGMAVEATPGAMKSLDKAQEKKGEPLTKMEIIKVAGPHYVPAGLSGLITAGSMILSTKVSLDKNGKLAAIASTGQIALQEYQTKMIEAIGPEKEKEIRDKAIKEKIDLDRSANIENAPGSGHVLCYDIYSDRYYWSDIEEIRRGLNTFNEQLLGSIAGLSLNAFYEYTTPLEPLGYGDMVGFSPSYGLVELRYSSILSDSTGTPCLTVDFRPQSMPRLGFDT